MAEDAVVFKFTNVKCESFNKSWIEVHTCRLKAVARNKALLNFNGTIYIPAYRIDIRVEVFKKANGFKPWLFNTTLDVCRFHRQLYNPLVILMYNQFRDYSNLNHTCPYIGPQIIKDLYLRPELLNNLPMPSGEYNFRITWFFHGEHVLDTNYYFEYVEDLLLS
ncbi:uncharacterized protein [Drosophila tropicalis]|uniref:uncharacterized protein n=1 Tax=Drosophila tropicalis TaxID=46794 RepID=UPI0035ABFE38